MANHHPHNKVVKLVRYAHWTAVPLHMCGFAAQNFTTHLQSHIRQLPRPLCAALYSQREQDEIQNVTQVG